MPSRLELTLTPHELFALPPDTPATGPAIRVEVSPRDCRSFFALARLVKVRDRYFRLFFWDERRPEDDIFCAGAISDSPDDDQVRQQTTKTYNRRQLARLWKSPELPFCVALVSGRFGQVITEETPVGMSIDFNLRNSVEPQFLSWTKQEFQGFCNQLATDDASELNFFLKWQKLSSETKNASVTHCECGDWEQLRRLFTWVLQTVSYRYGPFPHSKETSSCWAFTSSYNHLKHPAIPFLRRWQKVICDIVCPSFWPEEPLCCSKWRHSQAEVEIDVTCDVPTAHEFMEAQLGLHDFFRPYLSAGEIEALFNPESEGLLP